MRRPHYSVTKISLVLCVATVAGCSNPSATRDGANLLAAYTTTVKQRIQTNATSRDRLADARRELVAWLNTAAVETEQANQRESTVLKIADDKTRYKLYESIIAASQAGVLAAPTAAPATPAASTLAVTASKARLDQLGAAAKSLSQLGTSASLKDQLKLLAGWIGAVGSSVEEAQKEREQHTAQGLVKVDAKRSEVSKEMRETNK